MKKYIIILLTIFLIPIFVNAETLTYDVCESGCEYTNLGDVSTTINNISDLSDKDIIININSDMNSYLSIGNLFNIANSVTINGNNHSFNQNEFTFSSKQIEIKDCNNLEQMYIYNPDKIRIENSDIMSILYFSVNTNNQIKPEEINLTDVIEIDETSINNLTAFILIGNFKIENMNFKNLLLESGGGTLNIYNSQIDKLLNMPQFANITTNIYNSKFTSIKYKNLATAEEFDNELNSISSSDGDISKLNYDIYDIDFTNMGRQIKSITTVYFDKEAKLKPGEKLNLVSYLDYYTEDKEIEYTIEDESIAKIENKELTTLKEGSTKITVTTDDGHVVYRINLVVEKATIMDKMNVDVPITGKSIKLWMIILAGVLFGVIGVAVCMLIRRKK